MGEKRKNNNPQGEENYDTINLPNTFWMFANFRTGCAQHSIVYLKGRFSKTWMLGKHLSTRTAKQQSFLHCLPLFPLVQLVSLQLKTWGTNFTYLYSSSNLSHQARRTATLNKCHTINEDWKKARELWHRDNMSLRQALPLGYARHSLLLLSRKQSVTTLWRHVSQVNKIRWEGHRPKCYGKIKDVSQLVKRDTNYTAWINGCFEAFHCR